MTQQHQPLGTNLHWTNLTTGAATSSGGLQPNSYEIPRGEDHLRTHAGNLKSPHFFGLVAGTPQGYVFFDPRYRVDEPSQKRIAACLAAFAMPKEGVEEHLQLTVDQFKYWTEMASLPPTESPNPRKVTLAITGANPRPELVIPD